MSDKLTMPGGEDWDNAASSLIETLESTITTLYGERCPDTEPGCPICDAWVFVDRLKEDIVA